MIKRVTYVERDNDDILNRPGKFSFGLENEKLRWPAIRNLPRENKIKCVQFVL